MRENRAPFVSRWASILLRRVLLSATDTPGEKTIMPWKRIKFTAEGQNDDADPVLLQYLGGKFVTVYPAQAAIAEPKWPMNG